MKKSKKYKSIKHQLYVRRKKLKKRRRNKIHNINLSILNLPTHINISKTKEPQISIAQILEYTPLFGNKNKPNIKELLSRLPRETIINIAITLNNLYGNSNIEQLDKFFSTRSLKNRITIKKLLDEYISKNPLYKDTNLYFTSSETTLLLLRYAFSLPYKAFNTKISEEEAEMLIFKLILLINEETTHYKDITNYDIPENTIFLMSIINSNMHGEDEIYRKNRSIMQLYLSVEFFKFLTKNDEYKSLYQAFLDKYRINKWIEYTRSIFAIVAMGKYKAVRIPTDLRNDVDNTINPKIINSLSIDYNKNITFSSSNTLNEEGNTDYKIFREYPLIKTKDDYVLYNWEFMIDSLYNSLYFEFKDLSINNNLQLNIPNLFTELFAEKTILNQLIQNCTHKKKYILYSEEKLKKMYEHKQNELGPPDYFIENKQTSSYIIFECKDIKIDGYTTESHDFDSIIDIYRNKLYKKSWKSDNGNKKYLSKEQPIGITQLTGHISNIRNKQFKYHSTNNKTKIYPVLVITDNKYIHSGFTKIANKWYQESLDELNITNIQGVNKPLIVMSFITMIKYDNLFRKNGFEYYFDRYYDKILNLKCNCLNNHLKSNISFDEFMGDNNYNLSQMCERLMKEIVTQN